MNHWYDHQSIWPSSVFPRRALSFSQHQKHEERCGRFGPQPVHILNVSRVLLHGQLHQATIGGEASLQGFPTPKEATQGVYCGSRIPTKSSSNLPLDVLTGLGIPMSSRRLSAPQG